MLQLTVLIEVSVCDAGVSAVGVCTRKPTDTPKSTPRTPSLETMVQQDQILAAATTQCRAAKSNPGPGVGIRIANNGSIAYARIAY
jgi:hypothetical protein